MASMLKNGRTNRSSHQGLDLDNLSGRNDSLQRHILRAMSPPTTMLNGSLIQDSITSRNQGQSTIYNSRAVSKRHTHEMVKNKNSVHQSTVTKKI